jgi:hypothetical protein
MMPKAFPAVALQFGHGYGAVEIPTAYEPDAWEPSEPVAERCAHRLVRMDQPEPIEHVLPPGSVWGWERD